MSYYTFEISSSLQNLTMTEAVTSSEMLLSVQEKSRKINHTPLIIREFVKLGEAGSMADVNGADRTHDSYLRVMQWNLLAQGECAIVN